METIALILCLGMEEEEEADSRITEADQLVPACETCMSWLWDCYKKCQNLLVSREVEAQLEVQQRRCPHSHSIVTL